LKLKKKRAEVENSGLQTRRNSEELQKKRKGKKGKRERQSSERKGSPVKRPGFKNV